MFFVALPVILMTLSAATSPTEDNPCDDPELMILKQFQKSQMAQGQVYRFDQLLSACDSFQSRKIQADSTPIANKPPLKMNQQDSGDVQNRAKPTVVPAAALNLSLNDWPNSKMEYAPKKKHPYRTATKIISGISTGSGIALVLENLMWYSVITDDCDDLFVLDHLKSQQECKDDANAKRKSAQQGMAFGGFFTILGMIGFLCLAAMPQSG